MGPGQLGELPPGMKGVETIGSGIPGTKNILRIQRSVNVLSVYSPNYIRPLN